MPRDPIGEPETHERVTAALNSIEMVTVHWWFLQISSQDASGLADFRCKREGNARRPQSRPLTADLVCIPR